MDYRRRKRLEREDPKRAAREYYNKKGLELAKKIHRAPTEHELEVLKECVMKRFGVDSFY